ncbi:MAG: hypothetical protein AAGL10_15255 [Pseudomonadota bacterium]
MLTAPKLTVTDKLVVGALALANNQGSLRDGIDRVRFWFEGNKIDVVEPTLQTFVRHDGSAYRQLGYWVTLSKDALNGVAQLYVEAVPSDTSMQNRVIGPYSYVLAETEFEYEVTIDHSQPVTVGQNYHDLRPALSYLRSVSASTGRVLGKGSTLDLSSYLNNYDFEPDGRIVVEWEEPVTVLKTLEDAGTFVSRIGGLHWRGSNITFDMRYLVAFGGRSGQSQPYFDGVRFTNSGGFDDPTLFRGPKTVQYLFESIGSNGAWIADCSFDYLLDAGMRGIELIRGCIFENVANDLFSRAHAVVSNVVKIHDSRFFSNEIDALTVTGPAGATLALSGANDTNSRTFTAKVGGISIGSFTVGKSGSDRANNTFSVQDVADWLNSLSSWSANVLDDTRRATSIGIANSKGSPFGDMPVDTPETLVTTFDLHADWYQGNTSNSTRENVLVYGNRSWDLFGQTVFLTENGAHLDFAIVNNAWHQNIDTDGVSQLDGTHSHLIFAHNSMPNQGLTVRANFAADAFLLMSHNVLESAGSEQGATFAGTVKSNHYLDGGTAFSVEPASTIGGSIETLFTNASNGNFTPQGLLSGSLVAGDFEFDLFGKRRGQQTAIGAVK